MYLVPHESILSKTTFIIGYYTFAVITAISGIFLPALHNQKMIFFPPSFIEKLAKVQSLRIVFFYFILDTDYYIFQDFSGGLFMASFSLIALLLQLFYKGQNCWVCDW